ncbi:DUF374 domain-containing protein [Rhodobacteraceae bacterium RKSG542]|uniref:lysophospholipid acyltransferase family protein n=1 Tax=Pseudovibrio flavus TaxID=2529854 RepID=UPI0012BD7A7B|nr:lysophospholipid acyltransferase family protein [Pseudovibrio flavus]MTI18635.1 DUF374 domain-containing protein [Pseudovibrio flavus]
MFKKLGRHPLTIKFIGNSLAWYLRFVRRTSKFTIDPPDFFSSGRVEAPYIVSMWHGQHFMMPFARPDGWDVRVMISRSADGEINAIAAEKLGLGLVRASGSQQGRQISKRGGMRGFIEALRCLKEGATFAMTADVPKGPARKSGKGIIQLAKYSGRPIIPVAMATSRHYDFNSWDKASLNLPFSHLCLCMGEPIYVSEDASDEEIDALREQLDTAMNAVTDRAYGIAKGRIK